MTPGSSLVKRSFFQPGERLELLAACSWCASRKVAFTPLSWRRCE
jgi:hypothetical protein